MNKTDELVAVCLFCPGLNLKLSLLASNEVIYKKPVHFVSEFHDIWIWKKKKKKKKNIYTYINLDYSLSLQYSAQCVRRAWYIWKLNKSIRHNFPVTLTFTFMQSSDWFFRKVMSNWFVQLSDRHIYIMSSDKVLDSYKGKSIRWNPNLTKCTGIEKSLLYWKTFISELVHLLHNFTKKGLNALFCFYQGGPLYVIRFV